MLPKKLITLILVLFMSSTVASELTGFDGFDWGSSRDDVVQVKGSPKYNWGTNSMWSVAGSESVGGYAIENVYFWFKEGCSKLKETISEPCYMWGGSYSLISPTRSLFDELTPKIAGRYGSYTEEITTVPKEVYSTKQFLGNIVATRRIFDLDDGSRVTINQQERDRAWSEWEKQKEKGVYHIGIIYESSEKIASLQQAEKNKSKDFQTAIISCDRTLLTPVDSGIVGTGDRDVSGVYQEQMINVIDYWCV